MVQLLPDYDERLVLASSRLPRHTPHRIPYLVAGAYPVELIHSPSHDGGSYRTYLLKHHDWHRLPLECRRRLNDKGLGDGSSFYTDTQPASHGRLSGQFENELRNIQFLVTRTVLRQWRLEHAQDHANDN